MLYSRGAACGILLRYRMSCQMLCAKQLAHGSKDQDPRGRVQKSCVISESTIKSCNKDIRKPGEPAIMSTEGSCVYV